MNMQLQDVIRQWVDNPNFVALHLKQQLLPVEGREGVIFPPTYAEEKDSEKSTYDINRLNGTETENRPNGIEIASIDSVGSQANRMEPLFKAAEEGEPENELAGLVPQITVSYGEQGKKVSLLEAGHRLGDALIRCTELKKAAQEAFTAYGGGNATPMAKLAPTSLVFGAWDSRDTYAKLPRLVQAVIRAWDVSTLTRSAQYTPALDYVAQGVFDEDAKEKAKGNKGNPLSARGFVHVPATGSHGGVLARGPIVRDVTVNLIALRRLKGKDAEGEDNSMALRHYVLGLALLAANAPLDGFLRAGCLLTLDPEHPSQWERVERSGKRQSVELDEEEIRKFARQSTETFGKGEDREVSFDENLAKKDKDTKK